MTRPAILVARAVFPETVARLREHFDVEDNPGDTIFTKPQLTERLRGKAGAFTTGSERIDAQVLMTTGAATLAAISAGAVFMGANTYIGNAPNFMVKAIAEDRGIRMPSFFGYMAWSGCILIPLFVIMTLVWFR